VEHVNRTILLAVATLTATAILVPTGAVPFDLTGTDEIADTEIELAPADGPNGGYAVLDEQRDLELLLTDTNPAVEGDGISSDAVVPLDRVFTITYTGEASAEVWIEDATADVQFYRAESVDRPIEGRANNVTLGPNGTVAVGLLIDTRGDHDVEDADTFSVNARIAEPSDRDLPEDDDDVDRDDREPNAASTPVVTDALTATETPTRDDAGVTTTTGTTVDGTGATTTTTTTPATTDDPTEAPAGPPPGTATGQVETTAETGTTTTTVDGEAITDGTDGPVLELSGVSANAMGAVALLVCLTLGAILAMRHYR